MAQRNELFDEFAKMADRNQGKLGQDEAVIASEG